MSSNTNTVSHVTRKASVRDEDLDSFTLHAFFRVDKVGMFIFWKLEFSFENVYDNFCKTLLNL